MNLIPNSKEHRTEFNPTNSEKRRYMVGYPVWNKQDMLGWMLEGVSRNFPPETTSVVFYFDGCTDDSVETFKSLQHYYLVLQGFSAACIAGPESVFEGKAHNILIDEFMRSSCEYLIVPQDDQTFCAPCIGMLEDIRSKIGDKLGIIGCRDGFDFHCKNSTGGVHYAYPGGPVVGYAPKTILKTGEWVVKPLLNTGPVIYNRRLISAIGGFDPAFRNFYHIEDYCFRSIKAGFTNVVAAVSMIHTKFGRCGKSCVCEEGFVAPDLALIQERQRAFYGN